MRGNSVCEQLEALSLLPLSCARLIGLPVLATRCRITEAISLKIAKATCNQYYICM